MATMATTTERAKSAGEIRAELDEAFRASDYHGSLCTCCDRWPDAEPDLRTWLARQALYALDRYRPSEGYPGTTDDQIDNLVSKSVEAALQAARQVITEVAVAGIAGDEPPTDPRAEFARMVREVLEAGLAARGYPDSASKPGVSL